MLNTEHLRKLMTFDAETNTHDIQKRFEQIAQLLFSKFAIQTNNRKYLFKEIEFFFYNKKHRDIITHPRTSEALCWYVNDFGGIDLNFASNISSCIKPDKKEKLTQKYILDDEAYFGGILIRQLVSEDRLEVLNGPWACADLFRCFTATGTLKDTPVLVEHDSGMVSYVAMPRINILTKNQTAESKVDYIVGNYHETPKKEGLYTDFSSFIKKRYRYIRCDNLIHDKDTNTVFLSPLLKESHPEYYRRLLNLLNEIGVEPHELKATRDYWARDYMPVQLGKNEFLKYRYYPDYLVKSKKKDDINSITDSAKVLRGMGINCHSTKLIIDGGNMITCGPYIVMTDKVFTENGYEKGNESFKTILETELKHPVIIIPWNMHGDFYADDTDKYGHSDGFIRWCGNNRILMGNHGDRYPKEAKAIREILESFGFVVTEMSFNDKVSASPCTDLNWAYINFLQVGKNIIMPTFNIEEDSIAQQYIQEAFPECNIFKIDSTEIAFEGGALHCISWNVLI